MRAEELLNYITTETRTAENGKTEYRGIFRRGTEQPLVLTEWYSDKRLAKAEAGANLTQGLLEGKYRYIYKYDPLQELNSISTSPPVKQEAEHISEVLHEPDRQGDLQSLSSLVDAINAHQEEKTETPVPEEKQEPVRKKRYGWIPVAILGAALVSLPFWAIPWKVQAVVPEGAALQEALPETVHFYEKIELPACAEEGKQFLGWFTDSSLQNWVQTLEYTLGTKTLYAGFAEETEQSDGQTVSPVPEAETSPVTESAEAAESSETSVPSVSAETEAPEETSPAAVSAETSVPEETDNSEEKEPVKETEVPVVNTGTSGQ